MPFLKNDGTVITDVGVVASKNYDYNLAEHNSYGLSVQLIYANTVGFTATADLMASNDGVNFVSVISTPIIINANGSTIWDLTNTSFKIARVAVVVTAGVADLTLVYNSINLV